MGRRTWRNWLRGVATCGLFALCFAVPMWGLGRVLAFTAPVLWAVTMTGTVALLSQDAVVTGRGTADTVGRRSRSNELAWWCLVGAAGASVVLGLAVAAVASSAWIGVWLGALVVTTPPMRAAATRYVDANHLEVSRGIPSEPSGTPDEVVVMRVAGCIDARLVDLGTEDLCHLWRVTYSMVLDVRSPQRTAVVVDLRQAVLDELERRQPDATERWLTSGSHDADGPARYM